MVYNYKREACKDSDRQSGHYLIDRVDTIVSDRRYKVEENTHIKNRVLNINGYQIG